MPARGKKKKSAAKKKSAKPSTSTVPSKKGNKRQHSPSSDESETPNSDDEPESDARPPAKRTRSQPLKPSKSGAAGTSKGKKSAKVVESEEVEDDHTEEEVDEVEVEGSEDEEDEDDEDDDGLQPQHHASITAAVVTKDDMTKDLRTIFSDLLNVKFTKNGEGETIRGRWCLICKCIPRAIWREMEAKKLDTKVEKQMTLDGVLQKVDVSKEFMKDSILDAVSRLVACDDQAFALASKGLFRNCLVAMRPRTKASNLPSSYDVSVHIHKAFVTYMAGLKGEIEAAPGLVSIAGDTWTRENTKEAILGGTARWMEVKDGKWALQSAVIGFQRVSGDHGGLNLGRYLMGLCDRVGITSKQSSKLYTATLDNASNNDTSCTTIKDVHNRRGLVWKADENQLPCLGHVTNLANVDVMRHITKVAAVETSDAIWTYDPSDAGNRVHGGSLDVVATVRTLGVKINSSSQRIEQFEKIQTDQCKLDVALKFKLHGNTRWGSAHGMLDRAFKLRQAIDLFVSTANQLYGPITTIRQNGTISKKIPWSAFALTRAIGKVLQKLEISLQIPILSSNIFHRNGNQHYGALFLLSLYKDAIGDGRDKIIKYYNKFDAKPAYILALALHPYYKLDYIELAWGGEKEQKEDIAKGILDAKNWQDEARQVLEKAMGEYWAKRSRQEDEPQLAASSATSKSSGPSIISDFEQHRRKLVGREANEGWEAELQRYLKDRPRGLVADMDIVSWWQVLY
ncbi:hypothetical protein LshimejAT787_2500490 [Lyophyllum shimeji]|uniref:AC9 transposase n=1 Tax=Lyophyllum shimeji TaxID=47721 RepID=A0A9P3UUZ9_LYOSH|nr:hypothetical protein LshimejAT787_2500490 [Lyophyllum shimeji]